MSRHRAKRILTEIFSIIYIVHAKTAAALIITPPIGQAPSNSESPDAKRLSADGATKVLEMYSNLIGGLRFTSMGIMKHNQVHSIRLKSGYLLCLLRHDASRWLGISQRIEVQQQIQLNKGRSLCMMFLVRQQSFYNVLANEFSPLNVPRSRSYIQMRYSGAKYTWWPVNNIADRSLRLFCFYERRSITTPV